MEMEIDRLSALPSDLLIHILGRLDVKQAASTSSLSKRWRYVWTDLPSLHFYMSTRCRRIEEEEVNKFKASVRGALASRRGAALELLSLLSTTLYKCLDSDVDAWLELAAENKVQHLSLSPQRYYTVREIIYSNSWLKGLSLCGCIMAPPKTPMEWRSMTEISLSHCPALSSLSLRWCRGFDRLEIGGPSFRSLHIEFIEYGSMEISAPYMRDLIVEIYPRIGSLRFTNVVSLEKVKLKVHDENSAPSLQMMTNTYQFLQTIRCANILVLRAHTIKVLSTMATNGWPRLPQFKVECMEIYADYNDVPSIHGAILILESSPFLERFSIFGSPYQEESIEGDRTTRCYLNCDLLHLKTVIIKVYVDVEYSCKSLLALAHTLLERAPILEEMEIYRSKRSTSTNLNDSIDKFETLFSCLKSSHKAKVVIS